MMHSKHHHQSEAYLITENHAHLPILIGILLQRRDA